jgi:hypothetical protein
MITVKQISLELVNEIGGKLPETKIIIEFDNGKSVSVGIEKNCPIDRFALRMREVVIALLDLGNNRG